MWGLYFIEAHGYEVTHNILYQVNKSTILLAQNGRWSSSKRTKHINNRFFLVKDKIDRGELEVEHCGTKSMWSNVLTKPLQGRLYCEMRSQLMNCPVDYSDEKELAVTHPDLLPEGGWSDLHGGSDALDKAVQLLVMKPMKRQSATPPRHHRSVLKCCMKAARQGAPPYWAAGASSGR